MRQLVDVVPEEDITLSTRILRRDNAYACLKVAMSLDAVVHRYGIWWNTATDEVVMCQYLKCRVFC
ncbi:MAG: hypothetical protein ACLU4J_18520 [Butyricimonas paravirosa]